MDNFYNYFHFLTEVHQLILMGGKRMMDVWRMKVKVKSLSRVRLFVTLWTVACTRLLSPWDFLGKSTVVGCHFLLQGIFPTQEIFPIQGSNPGLLRCRQEPSGRMKGSRVVSWGYCNQLPQTRCLQTMEIYGLTILETRSLKSRYWQDQTPSDIWRGIHPCLFPVSGSWLAIFGISLLSPENKTKKSTMW